MVNFCTNCGTRLGKEDNFCPNCGAKIDKSNMGQNSSILDSKEKKEAKEELKRVVGGRLLFNATFRQKLFYNGLAITTTGDAIRKQVEKEIESGQIKTGGVEFRVNQLVLEYKIEMEKKKEEEKKKLKMIDEIFESEEIRLQTLDINDRKEIISIIKDNLKHKLIAKRENMSEDEIKYFIKNELENVRKEQEEIRRERHERAKKLEEEARIRKEEKMRIKKLIENGIGGYCGYSCRYCDEEFISVDGDISYNHSEREIVNYRCTLGYLVTIGKYCEHYKR